MIFCADLIALLRAFFSAAVLQCSYRTTLACSRLECFQWNSGRKKEVAGAITQFFSLSEGNTAAAVLSSPEQ